MGIDLIADIQPKNAGAFPTHLDVHQKGGFQVRSNVADRDSIPSLNRKDGMLVYVVDIATTYRLGPGLMNADWVEVTGGDTRILPADPNTGGTVNPGVNGTPTAAPATEVVFRWTTNDSLSDWLNWGQGSGVGQIGRGVFKFGDDAQVAQSGALRFATPTGTRATLMASRNQVTGRLQSIIGVSSDSIGGTQTLEIGREFFDETFLYGKGIRLVTNAGLSGDDGSAWLFEQEYYGYVARLQAQQTNKLLNWTWAMAGAGCTQATVGCQAKSGIGTILLYQAGESTNGQGGDAILRGGYSFAGQPHGGVKLQFNTITPSTILEAVEPTVGNRVLALCKGIDITSTHLPAGSGDLVVHIAPAATVPTVPPGVGTIVYIDPASQDLNAISPDGTLTRLAGNAIAEAPIGTSERTRIADAQTTTAAANQVIEAGAVVDGVDFTLADDAITTIVIEHIVKKKGSVDGGSVYVKASYSRSGGAAPVLVNGPVSPVYDLSGATLDGTTVNLFVAGNAVRYRVSPESADSLGHRIKRVHLEGRDALELSDLVLAAYFREPDYSVLVGTGTWPGTASAGASGGFSLTESTNEPAASGAGAPDFDGVANRITDAGSTFGTWFTVAAGTLFATFDIDAAASTNPFAYNTPAFLADVVNAGIGLHFSTAGVTAVIYDGIAYRSVTVACATGKHSCVMRWDGTMLELSVDGGAWHTTPCGSYVYGLGTVLTLGTGYGGVYLNGRIRCLASMKSKVSDAVAAQFRVWSETNFT